MDPDKSSLDDLLAAYDIPDIRETLNTDPHRQVSLKAEAMEPGYETGTLPNDESSNSGTVSHFEDSRSSSSGSGRHHNRKSSMPKRLVNLPETGMTIHDQPIASHQSVVNHQHQPIVSRQSVVNHQKPIVTHRELLDRPSQSIFPQENNPHFRSTPPACSSEYFPRQSVYKSPTELAMERRYQSNVTFVPRMTHMSTLQTFSNSPPNAIVVPTYNPTSMSRPQSHVVRFIHSNEATTMPGPPPYRPNTFLQVMQPAQQSSQPPFMQQPQTNYQANNQLINSGYIPPSINNTRHASSFYVNPVTLMQTGSEGVKSLTTSQVTVPLIQKQGIDAPNNVKSVVLRIPEKQLEQSQDKMNNKLKTMFGNTSKNPSKNKTHKIPEVETALTPKELAKLDPIKSANPIPTYTPPIPPSEYGLQMPPGGYKCPGCDDAFLFESSLDNHLSRKSVRISFSCNACPGSALVFSNKCALFKHLEKHNTSKTTTTEEDEKSNREQCHSKVPKDSFSVGKDKVDTIVPETQMETQSKDHHLTKTTAKLLQGELVCKICSKTVVNLALHFAGKDDSDVTRCTICSMFLSSRCSSFAHAILHGPKPSENSSPICPECGEQIKGGPAEFVRHLTCDCFHFARRPYLSCFVCHYVIVPKANKNTSEFLTHYISKHSEKYYKCQICPMAFKSDSSFKAHKKGVHSTPSPNAENMADVKVIYKCPMCNTVFNNYALLMTHAGTIHEGEIKAKCLTMENCGFKCPRCIKSYSRSLEDFKVHMTVHCTVNSSKHWSCCFCAKAHMNDEEYQSHLLERHIFMQKKGRVNAPGIETLVTQVSASDTKSVSYFQKIAPKVPSRVPSESDIKTKLKKAEYVDKDKGPMQCPVCKRRFANRTILASHCRAHEKDGQFVCCICTKEVLDTKDNLMIHRKKCSQKTPIVKIKKEDRTQVCSYCSEKFYKQELVDHLKEEHGVDKLLPCYQCGQTYNNNNELRRHIQIIHEGKRRVYTCWICLKDDFIKTFSKKGLLQKHITSKHKVPGNQIDFTLMPKSFAALKNRQDEVKSDDVIIEEGSGKHKIGETAPSSNSPVKRLKIEGDETYSCAKCDYSSDNQTEFQAHITTHKAELATNACQCPECGICFVMLSALQKHLFVVHKIKNVSKYCQSNKLDDLPAQKEQQLEDNWKQKDEMTFQCNVCFNEFDSEVLMKRHVRTHGVVFLRSKRASHLGSRGDKTTDSSAAKLQLVNNLPNTMEDQVTSNDVSFDQTEDGIEKSMSCDSSDACDRS